jgi:hypothetical protein
MQRLKRLSPHKPKRNKNRLHFDDLSPDGVRILIDWGKIKVGMSIFVPCVNTVELIAQVQEIADKRLWYMECRPRIENGKWGVRFWRIL